MPPRLKSHLSDFVELTFLYNIYYVTFLPNIVIIRYTNWLFVVFYQKKWHFWDFFASQNPRGGLPFLDKPWVMATVLLMCLTINMVQYAFIMPPH